MLLFSHEVWMIPLIYLISFLIIVTVGRNLTQNGIWIGLVFAFLSFLLSLSILIERLNTQVLDYSYHLDWIIIGDTYYSIGFEINNMTSWLLLLINTIFFFLHIIMVQKRFPPLAPIMLAFLQLLMLGLCVFLLADDLFTLMVGSIIVSCSIYIIVAHDGSELASQSIIKFVRSHSLAHLSLLVMAVVLYWYMPSHAMQFSMIQTVFSGQWEDFTPRMIDMMSLLIIVFVVSYAGWLPFNNWIRAFTIKQMPIHIVIVTICLTVVPTFVLIRFADLMEHSQLTLRVSACIGFMIIAWVTLRMLMNKMDGRNSFSLMIVGIMLYTYSYQSYGYMLIMMTLWILAIFVAEISLLQKNSVLLQGAFFIAAITLIGIPPLSGYWLHQWIITKLSIRASSLEYIIGLILLMLIALNSFVYFFGHWKKREREYQYTINVLAISIIPVFLLVFFGVYWMIYNDNIYQWLFDDVYHYDFRIEPLLLSMGMISVGAIVGWIYSEKLSEKWEKKQCKLENEVQTHSNRALQYSNKGITALHRIIIQFEKVFEQLFTEWLPYPFRAISRYSVSASWLFQAIFVVGLSVLVTLLYLVWGR